MLQAAPRPPSRRRWEWSTPPARGCRGVKQRGRKFVAQVTWQGESVYLGLFAEVEACRVSAKAYAMKRTGELDRCASAADVRKAVLLAMTETPRAASPASIDSAGSFPVSLWDGERVVQLGPFPTQDEADRQRTAALRRRSLGLPLIDAG